MGEDGELFLYLLLLCCLWLKIILMPQVHVLGGIFCYLSESRAR